VLFKEVQINHPPQFHAVGCVCRCRGRLLLLKRREDKAFAGCWGVPTGKMEPGENRIAAIVREIHEETGIRVSGDHLEYVRDYYVIHGEMSFTYALYFRSFDEFPKVVINPVEHCEYSWWPSDRVSDLPLVSDLEECLDDVRKYAISISSSDI